MPKLDATHIAQRLRKRLADLEAGIEVAARDIRALLTPEQIAAMDAAWAEQQALRKVATGKNEEEKQALGCKSKQDIHIEAYKQAISKSNADILDELRQMQDQAEIRQAKIYFEAMGKALDQDRTPEQARSMANNALTRAGLARMDGARGATTLTKRDREIRKIEADLVADLRQQMTAEEHEQLAIWEEHEKSLKRRKK
jgi:hypothetical protein